MVKVPGTAAGVPAIETLIGRGLNINVTLLFSVAMYERVAESYIAGLEAFKRGGGDVSKVASVASFFISRIDTAVDAALTTLGDKGAHLGGKAAIANAKIAYERYQEIFSGARWRALEAEGARPQRLLWASTSTKNPAYRDTIYVEELIGQNTVNTMPPATVDAFRDHGVVKPDAILQDREGAHAMLRELAEVGVSLDAVTDALTEDGVRLFSEAFDKLLASVAERQRAFAQEGA
jgi:transaldolase/glucose-6-phosphate isomerase